MSTSATSSTLLDDLIVSILAVNNYPLEKAYKLVEALRSNQWMNLEQVATWTHEQAVKALAASGYDRGDTMNSIFASRLQDLALYVTKNGLKPLQDALAAGSKDTAEAFLLKLHGIGPAVVRNFWIMQDKN
jgi:endonuclease III-like uncharacterized protein